MTRTVRRSVGWSVCWSVIISYIDGKFHFQAPIGALFIYHIVLQIEMIDFHKQRLFLYVIKVKGTD